ncbi:hypothetical protein BDR22DRAFT_887911 [Usnea florida]
MSEITRIYINQEQISIPSPAVPKEHIHYLSYIIRQENTWGRLLVTLKIFEAIISTHNVFAPYKTYLQAFGDRDTDEERSRSAYYWQKDQDSNIDEFCYNIKYIARNDRPKRNPWSIRQIGVYERLDLHTGQSVWIILQPSERAYRRFRETTELPQSSIEGTRSASMALHTAILIAASREWGEYLEDLRKQMQRLDKEAIFSSVGKTNKIDFSVTLDERQKVQQCRSKLLSALHALDMDIDIIQGCEARYRHLAKVHGTNHLDASLQRFQWQLSELRAHRTATFRIMSQCTWTANLQERILEYRNDETMRAHSQALRDIASAQRSEGETMTSLTRQTAQDSKMLKALTIVASLYLPPTLLAVYASINDLRSAN